MTYVKPISLLPHPSREQKLPDPLDAHHVQIAIVMMLTNVPGQIFHLLLAYPGCPVHDYGMGLVDPYITTRIVKKINPAM